MTTAVAPTTSTSTGGVDAWTRIEALSERARHDRDGAIAELEAMFRSGRPSEGIDGPTDGRLVTFAARPAFDRAVAAITALWMPWSGKRFNAGASRGDNLLARSARVPARLLWPLYGMQEADGNVVAFDFNTWVEPGAVDPDMDVLVIDYASVDDNPRVLIKSIRDELVEVEPGVHLGKMLWRHDGGERHSLLAFFALRSDS